MEGEKPTGFGPVQSARLFHEAIQQWHFFQIGTVLSPKARYFLAERLYVFGMETEVVKGIREGLKVVSSTS